MVLGQHRRMWLEAMRQTEQRVYGFGSLKDGYALVGIHLRKQKCCLKKGTTSLNLYLKYCWARGIIKEPPHCPIDSIVIEQIKCPSDKKCKICKNTSWTKIDDKEEYQHFIDNARTKANVQGQTLACWELKIWQTAMSKS